MRYKKWLKLNTASLSGKWVAVTGSTGGIGFWLCRYLAGLKANLVLLDRNYERSNKFAVSLMKEYDINVKCITVDLEDFNSVEKATELLGNEKLNISDVARSVGYDDAMLFSKMFKKEFGVSPSEYRKKI